MTDYAKIAKLDGYEVEMTHTSFAILQRAIANNNFEKGWRAPGQAPRNMGELIALVHSEVSEAFEAFRNNEPDLWYEHNYSSNGERRVSTPEHEFASEPSLTRIVDGLPKPVLGKPQGVASELADVLIRIFDMADELDIPLAEAVIRKHAYNQTRPYRHGGKKA